MEQLHKTIGEHTPDNLIAGHEVPILVKGVTVAKGQGVLVRGTVIGIISATGLAAPVDSTKTDGSEVPYGILTDDINTEQDVDVKSTGYVSGLFNSAALTFGGTDTIENHENRLRERGIFVKENIAY
ncbi:head decoration protein [Anaerobacillus sp. MEB173]|uniref:head decoration protein n=1 Tax=Anaerobacillus sp. MEB173 TaxID=3383345 RepID=UPI003F901021